MVKVGWFLVIGIFVIGWFANSIYASMQSDNLVLMPLSFLTGSSPEVASPSDWVNESQIHVFKDRVQLDIKGAVWSDFADTNSMDPFLDANSNGIEIRPESAEQIHVGDIISYKSGYADGILIHRVIEKGVDDKGFYFKVKGDNNSLRDPGKIRFSQIEGVLVGIIY